MAKRSRRRRGQQPPPRGEQAPDAGQQQPASQEDPPQDDVLLHFDNVDEFDRLFRAKFRGTSFEQQEAEITRAVPRFVLEDQEKVLDCLLLLQFEATPYFATFQQALRISSTNDESKFREAAHMFWDAFQQATELGKWTPGRVHILLYAVVAFAEARYHQLELHSILRQNHLQHLRQLFHNETELTVVRVMVAFHIGCMPWSVNISPEEHMEICRAALLLEPTTEELQRRVVYHKQDTSESTASVAKIIDTWKVHLAEYIDWNPEQEENSQIDGVWISMDGREVIPEAEDAGLFQQTVHIGGCKCDCCHTTVAALGVTKLRMCSLCQNAYYCGEDCQLRAWKEGHSKACRPVGDVHPGDIMRVMRHKKKLELNGRLVKIVGQHDTTPKAWWVRFYTESDESQPFLVKTKYLVHIRPEA